LEIFMLIKSLSTLVLTLLSSLAMAAVELNAADQATLESVRGIGPTLSAKLLAERQKAAFKDWADVVERVPGVGLASAAKLSAAGLTVQGQPMDAVPAATKRRTSANAN
jgi:competence protein ComEA